MFNLRLFIGGSCGYLFGKLHSIVNRNHFLWFLFGLSEKAVAARQGSQRCYTYSSFKFRLNRNVFSNQQFIRITQNFPRSFASLPTGGIVLLVYVWFLGAVVERIRRLVVICDIASCSIRRGSGNNRSQFRNNILSPITSSWTLISTYLV